MMTYVESLHLHKNWCDYFAAWTFFSNKHIGCDISIFLPFILNFIYIMQCSGSKMFLFLVIQIIMKSF